MKIFISPVLTLIIFIFFNLISPKEAYAYLDPGTGSYILQLLIGILIGGIFAVRLFWNKIKIFFRNFLFSRGTRHKKSED